MSKGRVRILADDDGHWYAVPVAEVADFRKWLEAVYWQPDEAEPADPEAYAALRLDSLSRYTFADVRVEAE